jgi:hypothetical protein
MRRRWEVLSKFVRYEVGDGSKVRFWHDLWCEDQPLKISYPDLLNIACCKYAWVADFMQFQNRYFYWNIFFTRPVHDWEVEVVSYFFELLYSQGVRQGVEYRNALEV